MRIPLSLVPDEPRAVIKIQSYRIRYTYGKSMALVGESVTHTSNGLPPVADFLERALRKVHRVRSVRVDVVERFR
jgi:hypothetical protein